MRKKWEKFERIVAAIHLAEAAGAIVTWNEDIEGRQFDVVIRFKMHFYDYLVLIECKDTTTKLKAEKVDAFVTKSSDAGASKAIMVSASGFQAGAIRVARKHKIELFTLKAINEIPEEMLTDYIVSVLMIRLWGFRKTESQEIVPLTKDENKLAYEMNSIRLTTMGGISVSEIMRPFTQQLVPYEIPGVPRFGENFRRATNQRQDMEFTLPIGTEAVFPISEERIPVSHFLFSYWMEDARLMKPTPFDPTIYTNLGLKYEYKDELNDARSIIDASKLQLGFDTKLGAGKFYAQPGLKFSYFCESVSENEAKIYLVESYQHGQFIQAELRVPLSASSYYVEVTDSVEIARLRKLYEDTIVKKGVA